MSARDRSVRSDPATPRLDGSGESRSRGVAPAQDGRAPLDLDDLPDLLSDLPPDPRPGTPGEAAADGAGDAFSGDLAADAWADPATGGPVRRGFRGIRWADGLVSSLRLLAELALDPLLTPGLRRTLTAGEPVVVTVTVPGPAWVAPVEAVITTASVGRARRLTQASRPRASAARDPDREIIDLLAEGRPVVAIAPDADWFAPTLAAAADHALTVPSLDARLVTRAIAIWCGRRPRRPVEPEDLAGLDLLDVAAALRAGAGPAACLARLARASRSRVGPPNIGAAPPLAELAGYGPAHGWATALVADIARVGGASSTPRCWRGPCSSGFPGRVRPRSRAPSPPRRACRS